jgi:hypothetical protein
VSGINDRGTIVGRVGSGATERAVRWDGPEHTLAFLAGSDREPSSAYDISARGEIVGYVTVDGRARAARLADPADDAGEGP